MYVYRKRKLADYYPTSDYEKSEKLSSVVKAVSMLHLLHLYIFHFENSLTVLA